jgi:exo-beta-1,3-glucanase (GH17 family)
MIAGMLSWLPVLPAISWPVPSKPKLQELLYNTCWVAYAPTNYDPTAHPPVLPSEASIHSDLALLRSSGFDGLVTYGADQPMVVKIAQRVGFREILLGVWNPEDSHEMSLARESARSARVLGIIVGNEGLMFHRYDWPTLRAAMMEIRRLTGKPVSSTEVIESFFTKPELVDACDFLAVNAHPFFHGQWEADGAAEWTVKSYENLIARVPDKPVLFKEVGFPTAGDAGLSEKLQYLYYQKLCSTKVKFVFFEAFDALFKSGTIEQSWGIFRADRSPKAAASVPARCVGKRRHS